MRGGRGYYTRGSGSRRGGSNYHSSNTYGDRVNSNNRMGGRYDGNYSGAGGSNRYHSSNYDSRNRDNFNGGRRDMGTKRSYPDSSRDRSGDRKHSRSDEYRRTSLGHSNRTPQPPPPPPLGSSSESRNYRGSNSGVNTYRAGGERSHSSTHRNRSPPSKRPLRTGMISRPRGVMSSSSRGVRSSMRGTLRSHGIRREIVDLRIMRRKLFYAQQKDRQRVIKIARLTSTLRRRQQERRSKSPRRSRSGKKSSDSEDEDDADGDEWNKDENGDESKEADENDDGDGEDGNEDAGEKSDADNDADEKKKKSSSGKSVKKRSTAKSTEKDGDDNNDDDDDDNDNDNETESAASKSKTTSKNAGDNDEEDSENKASKSKQVEGDSSADAEQEKNEDDKADGGSAVNKVASKSAESISNDKKDGKKNEKENSRKDKDKGKDKDKEKDKDKDNEKSAPKKSSSKKDDKKRKEGSSTKDDKRDKDKKSSTSARNFSRRDEHSSNLRSNSRFIKLTCVHCNMKCVTFKDYSQHLHLPRHKMAIRQVAIRQRAYLMRLRMTQRTAQREIEEKSKEEYEPKFCHLCRLNYRQPKAKHQLSEHHKTIKKFLMPYCSTCHLAFKSPMLYETHRCSLDHIRNKALKNDSDSDNSGDDMREIDLNKYTTVDSVGEIDDDLGVDADEIDIDGTLDESQNDGQEDETGNRLPVGAKFIKKMECFFCSLCNSYSPVNGSLRGFSKKHCLLRAHLKAFLAHKGAEVAANKKDTEEQVDGEAEDDTVVVKEEKDGANEKGAEEENGNNTTTDDVDMTGDVLDDEELWNDVDKDLGDLLAEVEPNSNVDGEEDEDESVLNIDIESEKSKVKEMNGKKEAVAAAVVTTEIKKEVSTPKALPSKPKPQRKAAVVASNKLTDAKEKISTK